MSIMQGWQEIIQFKKQRRDTWNRVDKLILKERKTKEEE